MTDLFGNEEMYRSAFIVDAWRYGLTRIWKRGLPGLAFVMLNPSTADGVEDDATIRKCIGFAKHNGYGSILVFNLFAYRATKPQDLIRLGVEERVGPLNDEALGCIKNDLTIVAAWGSFCQQYPWGQPRIDYVKKLLDRKLMCVKKTADRPWHPLYVKYGPLETL